MWVHDDCKCVMLCPTLHLSVSINQHDQYYFPMEWPLVKNTKLQTTVKPKIDIYATGCFQWWKYSGVEVFRDGSIQGWKYSGMEVFRDGSIQGWKYSGMEVFRDGSIQWWKYSGMEVFSDESIQGWKYSVMKVFRDGSIQGWKYSGMEVPQGHRRHYRRLMNGLYYCLQRWFIVSICMTLYYCSLIINVACQGVVVNRSKYPYLYMPVHI